MKFTISCLLTLQMQHTKFSKDWPSNCREEYVIKRRTMNDDGHQTIYMAKCHLSDSGDIKMLIKLYFRNYLFQDFF